MNTLSIALETLNKDIKLSKYETEGFLWTVAKEGWSCIKNKDNAVLAAQILYLGKDGSTPINSQMKWFTVKTLTEKVLSLTEDFEGFYPMNASFSSYKEGEEEYIVCFLRTVNYKVETDGSYTLGSDNSISSVLWILLLKETDGILACERKVRVEGQTRRWQTKNAVFGGEFEDCRFLSKPVYINKTITKWAFLGVRYEEDSTVKQYRGYLAFDGKTARFEQTSVLEHKTYKGKNWIPIKHRKNGSMDAVYRIYPFCIVNISTVLDTKKECSVKDITCVYAQKDNINRIGRTFCGGSAYVILDNRTFTVIHEYASVDNRRLYTNRLVEVNSQYEIVRISHAINFGTESPIEYVMGLTAINNKTLLVAVGVNDRATEFHTFTLSYINDLLFSVSEYGGVFHQHLLTII